MAWVADVTDPLAVARMVDAALTRYGRLDILFANAGIGIIRRRFEDHTMAEIDEIIDVNVKGLMYTVKAALPHLRRSDAAEIVTLVSQSGLRVLPLESVYCGSKFAQWGFTRALDRELFADGIRCTAICPGGVRTRFAMGGRGREEGSAELDPMLSPDDVADAVVFALTRPRSYRLVDIGLLPMSEEV